MSRSSVLSLFSANTGRLKAAFSPLITRGRREEGGDRRREEEGGRRQGGGREVRGRREGGEREERERRKGRGEGGAQSYSAT